MLLLKMQGAIKQTIFCLESPKEDSKFQPIEYINSLQPQNQLSEANSPPPKKKAT